MDGLWKVLTSLTACPEEVHLQNTHCLTEESLGQLFNAIALSECVHTFRVLWTGNVRRKVAAFCEILKSNRSIRNLYIFIETGTGNLANSLVHALSENVGIDTVLIAIETIKMVRTARDISHFLVHNKAATSFSLTLACPVPTLSVKKLSNGM